MSETYVIVKDGFVIECISVNSINDLTDIYTEHLIKLRNGEETIGWGFDGLTFTPPIKD